MSNFQVIEDIKSNLNLKISSCGEFANKSIKGNINILHLNIQSLRNKLTTFTNLILASNTIYHVIVLSETHIKRDEKQFFNLPGYEATHCTRDGRMSGGVSIFVLRSFSNFNVIHSKDFELNGSLLIELDCINIKILGFYKYRQSNLSNFISHLAEVLEENDNCIIVGDFNFDLFKINSNSDVKEYHDLIISNGHIFLNDLSEPTRIDLNRGTATLIDHVFSDLPLTNPRWEFNVYLDDILADHRAILLSINTKSTIIQRNLKSIKVTKTDHAKITSDNLIASVADESFESFQIQLSTLFQKYTSCKIVPERFRKPFMNSKILTLMEIRNNYSQLARRFPWSLKANTRFKHYRNLVVSEIRKVKTDFYDARFSEDLNDPKKFWSDVTNLLRNSDVKSDMSCKALNVNGIETRNKYKMVECFNISFINAPALIKNSISINSMHFNLIHESEEYTILRPTTDESLYTREEEVLNVLASLKSSFASDCYGFSNNIFKLHKTSLSIPLTKLINNSIASGSFPQCLKIAKVSPLYKLSGSKKDANTFKEE